MRLAPGLTAINQALGVPAASIAGISGGVSRIAGAAEDAIEGRMNFKDVVGNIKKQGMTVHKLTGKENQRFHLH
jgi:hypothetical protein